jgi:hypothetical protein
MATSTWGNSHQGFSHCPYFVGACASNEHVGQALGHLRLIATIALEDLGMEPALTIAGNLQVLDPARRGDQITSVGAVTIALALGTAFSPPDSDERVELFTHHIFQHHANGPAGQFVQMLPKFVLIGQSWGRLPLR